MFQEQGVDRADSTDLLVLVVELSPGAPDPFEAWVVRATTKLVDGVRTAVADASTPVLVVQVVPRTTNAAQHAAAAAAWQAARAVVQAATLETEARPVVNLVRLPADADSNALESVVRLLSGANGGFIVGASFDLVPAGQIGATR
ncbi:hypothetical protein GCM10010199_46450 [Dactylosporangium roseum]